MSDSSDSEDLEEPKYLESGDSKLEFSNTSDISIQENEETDNCISIDKWVVVQYTTNKTINHFVGQVQGKSGSRWTVKFTRISKNKFVWPTVEDMDDVDENHIIKILPNPVTNRRGIFEFKLNIKKYKFG
ncbi:hypothetical protein QE152_g27124 [Popillia japonica]|uniref:Uncharacterized protein n=1 Tax=Popillia japonica TaxID=7064 RepID=A0AAW1JUI1_POPJA